MLYITTRDNKDAFTSYKALNEELAADGGCYVPFKFPFYDETMIGQLKEKSFGQNVAEIMNAFFSCHLNGWDIDFCVGRTLSRLVNIHYKTVIAELWHNQQGQFSYLIDSLYKLVDGKGVPTSWFKIATQIAVLFGVYAQMLKSDIVCAGQPFDISVSSGDLSAALAALYAKKMGLPIDTVICSSVEDSTLWDFLQRGTFHTSDENGALLSGMERFVHTILSQEEAVIFQSQYQSRKLYSVDETQLALFNEGLFSSVASATRSSSTINSVFRSDKYIIDSQTAVCYSGLQDYRTKTGTSKLTLDYCRKNAFA